MSPYRDRQPENASPVNKETHTVTPPRRLSARIASAASQGTPARRRRLAAAAAASVFAGLLLFAPAAAIAEVKSPQWAITSVSQPANFAPGDSSDSYMVTATNTGGAPTDGSQVSIVDTLPPQLSATEISAQDLSSNVSFSCDLPSLTCTTTGSLGIGDQVEVWITFAVPANPSSGTYSNSATVSGGGAATATTAPEPTPISTAPGSFGLAPGSFFATPSTTQAGAHADLTTSFLLNTDAGGSTDGFVRDVVVDLPPGFSGDPNAVPTCTEAQLMGEGSQTLCPANSQVGTIEITINLFGGLQGIPVTEPLYNIEVPPGAVAVLGFNLSGIIVQDLVVTVRPGDSGLQITTPNISGGAQINGASVTLWGVPADPVHDPMRGEICFFGSCFGGGNSAGIEPLPYFSNSTRCAAALTATISANSWEDSARQTEEASIAPRSGCEHLGFAPQLSAQLTTGAAESPTGLNASLIIPQTYENPVALATAHLKKAVVTLPEGMSLNPSAGSGLGVCTPAQYEAETATSLPGEGCPNESQLGAVEVETPVLKERAKGFLYLAKPFDNPFDSLLALYLVARIPERGVIVKTAGRVEPNPITGQLTTTFDNSPQVPFNKLELKFRQGATSPLVSPPACGTYTALADLSPWSAPLEPRHLANSFEVEHGIGGGACPSGGVPPFNPELHAGTINNLAGAYSPFYVKLSRQDGEQEITHFSIKLPPGLVGKLAGIPFCSDAQIAQALSRSHEGMAAIEEADPSCPAASQVGRTIVEAGVGTVLAQAPGKVYLAGPYHGSAVSIVAITDAHVGPFDLGTVVVREGFKVNPETAEVFVDATGSDPLPHIVDGIPTHLRNIRVYMDRPNFVLNPTSCEPTSTASTVLGSGKDFASEADDVPFTATSPFQAADCASLGFHPNLKLSLRGGTRRGAHPALKAVLTTGPGEANIARAEVTLPRSEFLENAHIRTICTRVQFAAGAGNGANCPPASIYGYARATTPILSEPLQGPVYLRSSEHQLPDLVAALHSGEINIDLLGHIDSLHGQIRNTFEAVPDAPVTSFTLEMQGGGKGLLVNSTNLCTGTHRAIVNFTAHNGKLKDSTPVLRPRCAKHHKAKHKHKHKHRRARRGR